MILNRLKELQKNLQYPVLIKKKENLYYLTGRFFMHGYLLVGKKRVVFFGDGLEKIEKLHFDTFKNVGKYLKGQKILRLENYFTFGEYDYINSKIKSQKSKVKIQHIASPVDEQRQIKDVVEIKKIRKSMQIVEQVFKLLRKEIKKPGMTEIKLAEFIQNHGLRLGAQDVSFPPIVAAGANAAVPHHVPTHKKLQKGESIIIDFGFKYQGYCSDFTRTVFLKTAPRQAAAAYLAAEKAYNACIEKAKVGEKAANVHLAAVGILAQSKLDKYFIHSLGHGTGLEIHEGISLSPNVKDVLKSNMVFSIEPGVYVPKSYGIRIEDLVYTDAQQARKFIQVSTAINDNIL